MCGSDAPTRRGGIEKSIDVQLRPFNPPHHGFPPRYKHLLTDGANCEHDGVRVIARKDGDARADCGA
jgi:hypothetical protein